MVWKKARHGLDFSGLLRVSAVSVDNFVEILRVPGVPSRMAACAGWVARKFSKKKKPYESSIFAVS
jgi:hypothetical protein